MNDTNINFNNLQKQPTLFIPGSSLYDLNHSNVSLLTSYSKTAPTTYRSMIFVTFSAWMGFASLLLFQANLLNHIQSNSANHILPDSEKSIFEHGVSATFVGTFIFRVGHEIFWCRFTSKTRVVLALCCMICSMLILSLIFFIFNITQCWYVIIANLMGGIAIGAIEPNLLSSILPFGDDTKVWAFYGISLGFNFMAVIGYSLLSIDVPLIAIYCTCAALCFVSIFVYLRIMQEIPSFMVANNSLDIIVVPQISVNVRHKESYKTSSMRLRELKTLMKEYKHWFLTLLPFCVLLTLNLFNMNFFCTISLYVFYDGKIPFFTNMNGDQTWINRDLYFAISGVLNTLCQILGNRTSYYTQCIMSIGQNHPYYFIIVELVCGVLCSCVFFIEPLVALLGIAGVYLMNGAIYSSGVKYIDCNIHQKYNLISLSVWLLFADIGSILGQNAFEPVVAYICNNDSTPSYYCQ